MKTSDYIVLIVMITVFAFVAVFTSYQLITTKMNETDEIYELRLDSIRSELQDNLNDAAGTLNKLASGAQLLYDNGASNIAIEKYIYEQKASQEARSGGFNFNSYIAGSDWAIIPDFDMPADYHANERLWYIGAVDKGGEIYLSEPYIDSMTGNMCFTMSKVLDDRETVVAMDFTMTRVQESITKMMGGNDYKALIVSGDRMIVGYTDMSYAGKKAQVALPKYSSVLYKVLSSHEHEKFTETIDGSSQIVFSSETSSGWYMILLVDENTLYSSTYMAIGWTAVVFVALLILLIVFYLNSIKRRIEAEEALDDKNEFISNISDELRYPLNKIIKLSDSARINNSVDLKEDFTSIRESGMILSEKLENLFSYSSMVNSERRRKENAEKESHFDISKNIRKYRTRIISIFVFAMVFNFVINFLFGFLIGSYRITLDMDLYFMRLTSWVNEQQVVLDMFTHVIEADPSRLDDYDRCVEWLNDVSANYSDISVCYIANPYKEHQVIMNNGWEPDDDWYVKDRQWYKDTMASESGYSISAPYMDEQTGDYCITLSKTMYGESGEYLGVFGIDFFMDKLINIFDERVYSESYAFLADPNGNIINHPNKDYQMSSSRSVNVVDTPYVNINTDFSSFGFRDYDGSFVTGMKTVHETSGFTIYIVSNWMDVYGLSIIITSISVAMLFACVIVMIIMVNRIIRWQNHANYELAQAAKDAAAAGQAKSRFLAQMSHEIRTPINAVIGMDEMILRSSDDPKIKEYATNISSAGRTLLEIVNGILDFSKIEEGKMEIVPMRYEVRALVKDLYNMISDKAVKKGLNLVFDIDENMPSSLFGDDVRIKQIVINLLTNAVKYTDSGKVTFTLTGRNVAEDGFVLRVSVKDTGVGIREEDMDKLFKSFQRIDVEKNRNIEGTGLGISIVQGLLTMMDSTLKVVSKYGEGSEFYFDLRQKIIDKTPVGSFAVNDEAQTIETMEEIKVTGAEILVVDDNDMNLKVAKGLLKIYGITPDTADGGKKCIDMVQVKRYDLIFLDHMMPGMDGIETLKYLVREELVYDTPVICLTANAVAGMRDMYIKEGFDDYLSKPIDMKELSAILEKYLPEDKIKRVVSMPSDKTQKKEPEVKDPMDILKDAGFDTVSGIGYSGGSENFYIEMLRTFADGYNTKAADISNDFESKNWTDYRTRVHALKSTARMIGANELADIALFHETAAKEERYADIISDHSRLMDKYRITVRIIMKAFPEYKV